MKVDLHLHSKYSKRPSQWILQKIGCPESFAEPSMLNDIRRKMGFEGFTLTDHNTISGALEIAHLPGAFISEEITTYFPEDRCKAHVLAYDINEAVHEDIQKVRENIYDLVAYLNEKEIVHSLAHGLFSVNDRLTVEHFEKFLLLFRHFELNGARDASQNTLISAILSGLTAKDVEFLADKHNLSPVMDQPWRKFLTAGSDDHGALNVGRMYTEVAGTKTKEEFLSGVLSGRGVPKGRGATPLTLAHNLYGIAYQFYNSKFSLERYAGQDILMRFLDRLLMPEPQRHDWLTSTITGFFAARRRRRIAGSDKLEDVLRLEGTKTIHDSPDLRAIIQHGFRQGEDKEERWFGFVNQVCNQVIHRFGHAFYEQLSGANLLSVFTSMGAAGSLYTLMAPYFISFGLFARDARLQQQVESRFPRREVKPKRNPNRIKVAHFTDTFYEINGVALTLQHQAKLAAKADKDLAIITCRPKEGAGGDEPKVVGFQPLDVFELPIYKEQKLFLPPFLEMLRHVYEEGYTYIHSATPGPIGLAGLAAARILKLPVSGTYHTAIPQYAAYLTGDDAIEQMVWRYILWYYKQMEYVYVPSTDTGDSLVEKGVDADRIVLYPRGVDTESYHPGFARDYYQKKHQLNGKTRLLYVGRVSKEKNMPILADAFKRICRDRNDLQLIVVGDGPYLDEMKRDLSSCPALFTGYLTGSELASAYADADLFVFPSTTDTFGNVILEAQASGLPVLVTDTGGPRENILPEQTGKVVGGDSVSALVDGVMDLLNSPLKLRQMAREARLYAESRSFENAFLEHWRLYHRELDDEFPSLAKAS